MNEVLTPVAERRKEAELYNEALLSQPSPNNGSNGPYYTDPLSEGRTGNLIKIPFYYALQKLSGAIRDAVKGDGLIPDVLEAFFGGLNEYALSKYHESGLKAFKMPRLGGLNKIFQNGWSLAHLLYGGLTKIERAYTIRIDGEEYIAHIQSKGQPTPSKNYFEQIISQYKDRIPQLSSELFKAVAGGRYENKIARVAGVYAELTDYDVEGLVENPEKILPYFQVSELYAIGNGKRRKIYSFNGVEIIEYSRDNIKTLMHHAKTDFLYSIYGLLLSGLEKTFKGLRKVYVYDREARRSIKLALKRKRPDGYENPFYKYVVQML